MEAVFLSDHDELVESEDADFGYNTKGTPPLTSMGRGACGKISAGNQESRSKLSLTIPKYSQVQTRSQSQKIKGRHTSKTSVDIADADGKHVVFSLVCACRYILVLIFLSLKYLLKLVLSEPELGQKDEIDGISKPELEGSEFTKVSNTRRTQVRGGMDKSGIVESMDRLTRSKPTLVLKDDDDKAQDKCTGKCLFPT